MIVAYRLRFLVYILGNLDKSYLLATNMAKENAPTLHPFAHNVQSRDGGG